MDTLLIPSVEAKSDVNLRLLAYAIGPIYKVLLLPQRVAQPSRVHSMSSNEDLHMRLHVQNRQISSFVNEPMKRVGERQCVRGEEGRTGEEESEGEVKV